jgi:hypothetical protein
VVTSPNCRPAIELTQQLLHLIRSNSPGVATNGTQLTAAASSRRRSSRKYRSNVRANRFTGRWSKDLDLLA